MLVYNKQTFKTGDTFYGCLIQGGNFSNNRQTNWYMYERNHHYQFEDVHVRHVQFSICSMESIPRGLTEKFSNLIILNIFKSRLAKIQQNDLKEYRNLERFYCTANELEILPGDLFEGFKNLKLISFADNKLKIIEPNILDGLDGLKLVDFRNNPNYDKCYSVYEIYKPNATLQEVKDQLTKKYNSSLDKLINMDELIKTNKQLQFELNISTDWYWAYENINSKNNDLTQENYELKESEEQLKLENKDLKRQVCEFKESEEQLKLEIANLKAVQPQTDLAVDLTNYIQKVSTKDFKVIINDREFLVHKLILAARSPTFAELFEKDPDVEILHLIDIPVEIFEILLKFLYADELPVDDETNFLLLFAAACKLKIEKLVKHAASKILDQVNQDNALNMLRLCDNFGLDELKEKAFEEVKNKYKGINFRDELMDNPDGVIKIIKEFEIKEAAKKDADEELRKLSIDCRAEHSEDNKEPQ